MYLTLKNQYKPYVPFVVWGNKHYVEGYVKMLWMTDPVKFQKYNGNFSWHLGLGIFGAVKVTGYYLN